MKNQFDKFTGYELAMIQSFAVNAIISNRTNDRYEAIVDATLSMLYAKGYKLHPHEDVKASVLKRLGRYNVFTLKGEPSRDVVDQILSFIYDLNVVIIKDENREATFQEVKRSEYQPPIKKDWVM
jgi:hypothetical protein